MSVFIMRREPETGRGAWRICRDRSKLCRASAGGSHGGPGCGRTADVELNRQVRRRGDGGTFDAWWGYCLEHAYGRIVLDGGVWYAWEVDEDVAERVLEFAS
jgi:hypothetical protein